MTDRLHAFEAIDNFRDYGDYATAAGRRVKHGRLLRSAHHARASEADLERLKALDIDTSKIGKLDGTTLPALKDLALGAVTGSPYSPDLDNPQNKKFSLTPVLGVLFYELQKDSHHENHYFYTLLCSNGFWFLDNTNSIQ